jgi:hypothetical protein
MPRRDEYDDDRYRDDRYDDDRRRDDEYDDRRRDDRGYDDRDREYEDYEDRPRRSGRDRARERVALPAIFLMIIGGLGLSLGVLNAVLEALDLGGPNPFVAPEQANDPQFQQMEKVLKVVGPILNILWGLIVLAGGWQMKILKNRGFVLFSCVWAMLPCNGCCLLGIPFGIWAIIVVNDESVKRAF